MRKEKVERLFDFIKSNRNICVLKAPPGSGKSFFAALFRFYLQNIKLIPSSQIFEIVAVADCDYKKFKELFYEKIKFDFDGILNLDKRDYFFIFDEAQNLYNIDKFKLFWYHVKNCSEQRLNIHFLFCANYPQSREDVNPLAPLILQNKSQSLEFLQFEEREFSDLVAAYHKWSPNAQNIMISESQTNLLYKLLRGHPELSKKALKQITTLWCNDVKVSPSSKYLSEIDFRNKLFKDNFLNEKIISGCKVAVPLDQNFKEQEMAMINHIQIYGKTKISFSWVESEALSIMRDLERKGICYEDPDNFFHISNPLIGSNFFANFQEKKENPIENIQIKSKVEIAVETLKRMDKIRNAKGFTKKITDENLKEDQWVNEFFGSLKSILSKDKHFLVLKQNIDQISDGEIDVYLNNEINIAFAVIREGDDVLELILRKYRAIIPERFKNVKFHKKTTYLFPSDAEYLVIDLRSSKYKKLENYRNEENGNKLDLKDLKLENDLMRVIYDESTKSLEVHYQEQFLVMIDLI